MVVVQFVFASRRTIQQDISEHSATSQYLFCSECVRICATCIFTAWITRKAYLQSGTWHAFLNVSSIPCGSILNHYTQLQPDNPDPPPVALLYRSRLAYSSRSMFTIRPVPTHITTTTTSAFWELLQARKMRHNKQERRLLGGSTNTSSSRRRRRYTLEHRGEHSGRGGGGSSAGRHPQQCSQWEGGSSSGARERVMTDS